MQNSRLDNDKNDLCTTTVKWEKENIVKYATWNVRSVTHKEELDTIFKEQNTDIAVRRETKKINLRNQRNSKLYPHLQCCQYRNTCSSMSNGLDSQLFEKYNSALHTLE
jgi:hypothetical protein